MNWSLALPMETALKGEEGEKFDAGEGVDKAKRLGKGGGLGLKVCRIFYLESV